MDIEDDFEKAEDVDKGGGAGRSKPIGSNQHAWCREEGHWKNECVLEKKKELNRGNEEHHLIMLEDLESE